MVDIEEKQNNESEDGNSQSTKPKKGDTQEKKKNIFNVNWVKIWLLVAGTATIWLIISIINIVRLWNE